MRLSYISLVIGTFSESVKGLERISRRLVRLERGLFFCFSCSLTRRAISSSNLPSKNQRMGQKYHLPGELGEVKRARLRGGEAERSDHNQYVNETRQDSTMMLTAQPYNDMEITFGRLFRENIRQSLTRDLQPNNVF